MSMLRNIACLLFFSIFMLANLKSQELIYNGGFEEYYSLPDTSPVFIEETKGWDGIKLKPQGVLRRPLYWHEDGLLPEDYWYTDSTRAYSGKAFTWMQIQSRSVNLLVFNSGRSYLGTRLKRPMEVNKPYEVSFYMKHNGSASCAECIGLFFSTNPLYIEDYRKHIVKKNQISVKFDSVSYSPSNLRKWNKYSYVFIPDSAYKFMTLGVFKVDSDIVYLPLNRSNGLIHSYYDDFSVLPNWLYIQGDTSICRGDDATLRAFNHRGMSIWTIEGSSDVISEDTIITVHPEKTTTYIVQNAEESFSFTVYVKDYSVNMGNDTTICLGEYFELMPSLPGASYTWPDGSTDDHFIVAKADTYIVEVLINGCSISDTMELKTKFCDCTVSIPNAFTPNDDGMNDTFGAHFGCNIKNYNLTIFDRWGEKVFETVNRNIEWNGKFHGEWAPFGMYVYRLDYILGNETKGSTRGKLTLYR